MPHYALYRQGRGPQRGEPPPQTLALKPPGEEPRGQVRVNRDQAHDGQGLLLFFHVRTLVPDFLFHVPFSWKRKAVSGERLARACLGVRAGVWDPFLPGKEREGSLPPAFAAVHALCVFSHPTPFFCAWGIYRLLIF